MFFCSSGQMYLGCAPYHMCKSQNFIVLCYHNLYAFSQLRIFFLLFQAFVFDFGAEVYVWTGKKVSFSQRKVAIKLAQELWERGYDYTDCDINPICPLKSECIMLIKVVLLYCYPDCQIYKLPSQCCSNLPNSLSNMSSNKNTVYSTLHSALSRQYFFIASQTAWFAQPIWVALTWQIGQSGQQ